MQNIFLLIRQKCSKICGAHLRLVGLSYYSLCHYNNTFWAWSSLFRKHKPSKIFARCSCQNFSKVFLPASPFISTSPFIRFGDFCQLPHLLFWQKLASHPVYSILPFYLKLKSRIIQYFTAPIFTYNSLYNIGA